jgi:endonuclease-3
MEILNKNNTQQKIIKKLSNKYKKAKTKLKYKNLYQLLIAVILSAQTTDEQVNKVTKNLFKKYKNFNELANAKLRELQKIIKPTGYYKQKARYIKNTAKKIIKNNSKIPQKIEELIKLDGVGRKVANIVLYFGFKKTKGIAVDTHCLRISYRLGLITTNKNPLKAEKELMKIVPKKYWGQFTNWMVFHGREICKAKNPKCSICFLKNECKKVGLKNLK